MALTFLSLLALPYTLSCPCRRLVASPPVLGALLTEAFFPFLFFSVWPCLHFFWRSFLWLLSSLDRVLLSCCFLAGPSANSFRTLCCLISPSFPESRYLPPDLGASSLPGPIRYPSNFSTAFSLDESPCLSSEGPSCRSFLAFLCNSSTDCPGGSSAP